ncbi:hypothetical protein BG004_002675, partial [Podila humilis]
MHVFKLDRVVHENPYTGDKITTAFVVDIKPLLDAQQHSAATSNSNDETLYTLPEPVQRSVGVEEDNNNNNNNNDDEDLTRSKSISSTTNPDYPTLQRRRQRIPGIVAIKYLSDRRKVQSKSILDPKKPSANSGGGGGGGGGWSSCSEDESDSLDESYDDASSEEEEEEDKDKDKVGSVTTGSKSSSQWPMMGQSKVPDVIKFGVKARKEIRALKAAQGHPNVIPFLGFTGTGIVNPIKMEEERAEGGGGGGEDGSGGNTLKEGSALGSALRFEGGVLDNSSGTRSSDFAPTLSTGISFQLMRAGFGSSWHSEDSDANTVEDDDDSDDHHHDDEDINILEGLQWIHEEAHLIHRDISPGNILVGLTEDDGSGTWSGHAGRVQCMISDFGCATFNKEQEDAPTVTEANTEDTKDEYGQGYTFEVGT